MRNVDQSGCVLLRRILHQGVALFPTESPHVKGMYQEVIDVLPKLHHVMDPVLRVDRGDMMDDWFNLRLPFKTMYVEGVAPDMRVGSYVSEIPKSQASKPEAAHTIGFITFCQRNNSPNPFAAGMMVVDTDEDGDAIDIRPNLKIDCGYPPGSDESAQFQCMCCYPAALTIAMMNDPKITTVEVDHDRAIRKKFGRDDIVDAQTKYRVLVLKDALKAAGG